MQSNYAIDAMQFALCNMCYAIQAILSRLHHLSNTIQAMQPVACNPGYATYAMQSKLCYL
eukprot:2843208-Karenia_brevis.AAC.1